ncbi:MAG TPA: hypothetical protein DCE41_24965 [Cytophagales bacterium]|nr:hypothetical protein [Cytophagales bacterium]HAA23213.1 hypothetical protein [Cytophagales bacterium]HAP58499.1 hypothetical protein [Cytophagales bacterium]
MLLAVYLVFDGCKLQPNLIKFHWAVVNCKAGVVSCGSVALGIIMSDMWILHILLFALRIFTVYFQGTPNFSA